MIGFRGDAVPLHPTAGLLTLALFAVPGIVPTARAQTPSGPDRARIQAGPLAIAPAIRLTNVGYDSNVFSENRERGPRSDVSATLSPTMEAWLRLPGARVVGRSELDFVYFRELEQLRSLDTDHSVRAELLLSRLRPYVAGDFLNTRHRLNFEIDEPVQFRRQVLTGGAVLALTSKTSVDMNVRRATVDYDDNAVYFGTNLSRLLDRTTTGDRVTVWYAATPLTTIGFDVQRHRERFEFSPDRDSNRLRLAPTVEFKPNAVISGRAQLGVHRREFLGSDVPDAKGTFIIVDLRYTLRGSTQFAVQGERDIAYSYRVQQEEYRLGGFTASVTQRFGDTWDVRGRFGRHHLEYIIAPAGGSVGAATAPTEVLRSYGADLGYRLGRTRLGLHVSYRDRRSDISVQREHERFWIASSVSYAFD